MPCAFKPCPLEINSNNGLKREHLESSSSTTKNIISSLPQCAWLPDLAGLWLTMRGSHQYATNQKHIFTTRVSKTIKLDRIVTYLGELLPMRSHDTLIRWSWKITWETRIIISPQLKSFATKLWRMVNYLKGHVLIKSHDASITWSRKITWQTKTIISPLP